MANISMAAITWLIKRRTIHASINKIPSAKPNRNRRNGTGTRSPGDQRAVVSNLTPGHRPPTCTPVKTLPTNASPDPQTQHRLQAGRAVGEGRVVAGMGRSDGKACRGTKRLNQHSMVISSASPGPALSYSRSGSVRVAMTRAGG